VSSSLSECSTLISNAVFLGFLVGIPLYGFLKGVKVYESFVEGAKEGFQVAVRIIPYLVAILLVVGMVRASGTIDIVSSYIPQAARDIGLTPEIISLILVRPLSGAASLGILGDIVTKMGADSYDARLGSVILGSTETTLYVIAVYFGAVSITRVRYAIHAGLLADASGAIAAMALCLLFFR
jgi:spore maturation protein B